MKILRFALIVLTGVTAGVAAACRAAESTHQPVIVRNPDYLVLRSLSREPDAGHPTPVTLPYEGAGRAYASREKLLDLNSFELSGAKAVRGSSGDGSEGSLAILIPLNPAGQRALGEWTSNHIGGQLGVFLEGTLIEAPHVRGRIDRVIAIKGSLGNAQVERIAAALKRGGVPE